MAEYLDTDSIERCPHDAEHPYYMVSRSLIRDETISPNCRWLLIYLLSNKDGWRINVRQVVNHCAPHLGRDKIYKIFDEAIESGYMNRIETLVQGKKRYAYQVSEHKKFKKCLLFPENQDTEIQDTENQDAKGIALSKEKHIKDHHPQSPSSSAPSPSPYSFDDWRMMMISKGFSEKEIDVTIREVKERVKTPIYNLEKYLNRAFERRETMHPSDAQYVNPTAVKAQIAMEEHVKLAETETERCLKHEQEALNWVGKSYSGVEIISTSSGIYFKKKNGSGFNLPYFSTDEYWDNNTNWIKNAEI